MAKALLLLLAAAGSMSLFSCNKGMDNTGTGPNATPVAVPTLITAGITSITSYGAITGGSISDTGGASLLSSGVCYGTSPNPTTDNNKVYSNSNAFNFIVSLTGLVVNTTYYVRAFATNSGGTGYGNDIIFQTTFVLGQSYNGGIIFYINGKTGSATHGLIAAPTDFGGTYTWGCQGSSIGQADSSGLGRGQQNTKAIISGCTNGGIAASICDTLSIGGFGGWFLPSKAELDTLFMQRRFIDNFSNNYYWSSTQFDKDNAWVQNLATGVQTDTLKGIAISVRPISAF